MPLFTIPSSAPFLRTLIAALVDGRLIAGFEARKNPERLAEATLYLPTRRAGRIARDMFLDVMDTGAALLPRIVALGDIDEDELAFAQAAQPAETALDALPELGGLERRLTLAQLIAAWSAAMARTGEAPAVAAGLAATLALADDLARLIDDMTTRGVAWDRLDDLVPEEHDAFWKKTLEFLRVAREAWPAHLRERGRMEPAARRDLLIAAEAARLRGHTGPVIAAGSTGSMPATARLLAEIAKLPRGAVVLPGLDTDLDDAAWNAIGGASDAPGQAATDPSPGHPQFAMQALLKQLGVPRSAVTPLAPPASGGRELLASEALRPSAATADWNERLRDPAVDARIAAGMERIAVVQAATPEMEALAIAIAMREAAEQGIGAALVTPDRALARRTLAALGRWGLDVEDSAGEALPQTPAGLFARLVATALTEDFAPASLLALLKHPLLRLGAPEGAMAAAVTALERAVLRGSRPPPGLDALSAELAQVRLELAKLRDGKASLLHRSDPRGAMEPMQLDAAETLLTQLRAAFAPLVALARQGACDIADIAAHHRDAIDALSRDASGRAWAFEGGDGRALADSFDDLAALGRTGLAVTAADYPDVFAELVGGRAVRPPPRPDIRLRVLGPLEARLIETDRVILGGLIEGVWPPAPQGDAWLSRPMRQELGLDLPERRIGLSAHDFAQLLGAGDVVLTHAARAGGAPAVASRFLHRLEAVAGAARWTAATARGARYVALAQTLDRPASGVTPIPRPEPKPPVAARPTRLSVTEIEDWMRDPYTIYARHILRLAPLDPVDMPLSAADRGSAIHNALADYSAGAAADPAQAERLLLRIGADHFAPLMARPEARALWWPRFRRIAAWFAGWDVARRADLDAVFAEIRGSLIIGEGPRAFRLTSRADRIERRADGAYAIVDFKTGKPPSGKQVRLGLSPQLTLEAAILRRGGFDGIAAGASVADLTYVRLSGNEPAGEQCTLALAAERGEAPQSPDEAAEEAYAKLAGLIRRFEDPTQAYHSLDLAMWSNRYGVYDDLARVKEWSAVNGGAARP